MRTVTLQAAGIPAQLLPVLEFAPSLTFNSYPEKPELHNTARQQTVIGRSDTKVTYLLNKPGTVTLPAVHVSWFNIDTGKEEIVSLPERAIVIKAKGGVSQPIVKATPKSLKKTHALPSIEKVPVLPAEKASSLAWWIAGGFALAWIITLVLWRCRQSHLDSGRQGRRLALKRLHDACKNNNPKQAYASFLQWAVLQWPDVELLNVNHVAKLVHDTSLKKQLSLLSKAIYSEESNVQWHGDLLWRSITAYLHTKAVPKNKSSVLPPINPG